MPSPPLSPYLPFITTLHPINREGFPHSARWSAALSNFRNTVRACDSRPFRRQLPGMAWSGWRARQLSKTSSFVNKKEIRAAGNENKPEREGGRHYTVQAGLSKYGGGSMCCFSDSANGCCCLIDTQHWGELKPFKLGWLGWGRYPIHRIWKMYWVRLYGFYVAERFSAHFSENCSEADN